jgi:large subunit ribosomal protein L5e
MTFVKVQKNTAYFKRFQVKFRRRREGKTDYYQRKRLIVQRKNKYNTAKWRFVVRRTNTKVVCQVVWSTIVGDRVKCESNSSELKKYGLTAGLTNYSAAYCTGLLCAKRLLKCLDDDNAKKGVKTAPMSKTFDLIKEADGNYVNIEELRNSKNIEQRPFTCFLDLGLTRATIGNRVFGAVKGAIDGGLNIPCKDKIFPHIREGKAKAGNASKNPHRDRIFGLHVQNYMELLKKTPESFKRQFSVWNKCMTDNKVTKLEDLYKKIHTEIRKNPDRATSTRKRDPTLTRAEKNKRRDTTNVHTGVAGKKYLRDRKITLASRKKRVQDKINKWASERLKK